MTIGCLDGRSRCCSELRKKLADNDRRVSATLFEAADVLLTEPRDFGQLLLSQSFFFAEPPDVSPDHCAHVHARMVSRLHTLSLSTILCASAAHTERGPKCTERTSMNSRLTSQQYRK